MVVAERDQACDDAERHAGEPRREEAARSIRSREPRDEQRERIGRVTAEGNVVVVRKLADRRERKDRHGPRNEERSQKNLRAPRKSLVLIGTMRTSLREFGASIICPFPSTIETWPTTGLS